MDYRFLATRERVPQQLALPGHAAVPDAGESLDTQSGERYKFRGIVTNRSVAGNKLIPWYRPRCGKSEEVHAAMKEDLAGGTLPLGDFGANAAWWGIMILVLNLNAALKRLVLPSRWRNKRFKALRFGLISLAGQVRQRARQLDILLSPRQPALALLRQVRERIAPLTRGAPEGLATTG